MNFRLIDDFLIVLIDTFLTEWYFVLYGNDCIRMGWILSNSFEWLHECKGLDKEGEVLKAMRNSNKMKGGWSEREREGLRAVEGGQWVGVQSLIVMEGGMWVPQAHFTADTQHPPHTTHYQHVEMRERKEEEEWLEVKGIWHDGDDERWVGGYHGCWWAKIASHLMAS